MKMTLSTCEIADELLKDTCSRWSKSGALALAEYLEEYEESTGEEIELDTCAIRCDYSEWESLQAWAFDYCGENYIDTLKIDIDASCDAMRDKIREYIQDQGQLIEFDGGIIVSQF